MLLKNGQIIPVDSKIKHPISGWMCSAFFGVANGVVSGNGYAVRVHPDADGYVALFPGDWVIPGDEIRGLSGQWTAAEAIGAVVEVEGYYRRRYSPPACSVCHRDANALTDGVCKDCEDGVLYVDIEVALQPPLQRLDIRLEVAPPAVCAAEFKESAVASAVGIGASAERPTLMVDDQYEP